MARNQKDSIIGLLQNFENDILIKYWNEYCNSVGNDENIYSNDEWTVNEMFSNPYEALRACYYGEYNYTDYYFIIDCYGNLVSFGDSDVHSHINFDDLADYFIENGCNEITEVWYEDMICDFINYACEKTGNDFDEDCIPDGTDLVTEDWDNIIEEMSEKDE